ncbi:hypothetical protein BJ684DRAFT_8228 [Piptocephalis cylindrospora]|uniref:PQ loop repeat-domain-containing protein n=1 Tax=Piptocephalis cylindrospora TaxID=1907219 RepID=A0A4P9Y6H4_9FUNG|nr:hypothetical protein BJ684DRAFT_8228 [Piptocephalis cylindrospora]|eukprot:RKP14647.1 hypothetical protein BJ684DRAFT_8228 [Piptocephalis cylindrospora]
MDTALQVAIAVGPVLGYIDQVRVMRASRSSNGFSMAVCGILLVSSILRIFFWLGQHFDNALLYQSILMILVQLFLLNLCIQYRTAESFPEPGLSSGAIPMMQRFWQWPSLYHYIHFLLGFTLVFTILHVLFSWSSFYVSLIGVLSLAIEATLPLPQIRKNHERGSTEGFSLAVMAAWALGDLFKCYYYVYTTAPLQFTICGFFQLSADAVLVVQWVRYRGKSASRFNLPI